MLAALFALLTLPLDASGLAPAVAPAACGADRAEGCRVEGDRTRNAVRIGKRCHPDPTKSKSCREVLTEQKAPKQAALAAAR